ncbi:hypothetical protein PG994_005331 [Apiospora phragmitis]|uniref:Uncharacterized protein n=1 Tax=Apiospora phragmitis TaxID=2905665 RepID=A0ABR1VBZ2_9PEZI
MKSKLSHISESFVALNVFMKVVAVLNHVDILSRQKAIASLHAKSSEAVQLYMTTNGYAEPRIRDQVKDDDDEDDGDDASVVTSDSASSDTAAGVPTPASFTYST